MKRKDIPWGYAAPRIDYGKEYGKREPQPQLVSKEQSYEFVRVNGLREHIHEMQDIFGPLDFIG